MRAALVALLLVGACQRAEAPANNQAAPAPPAEQGDVAAAQRLVRERLGAGAGALSFGDARRSAAEGVPIVCGAYRQGAASHRYIVVNGEDVFVEPQMQPGQMDRAFAEFCRESAGNGPRIMAGQGNSQ